MKNSLLDIDTIRSYILKEILFDDSIEITDNQDLLLSGLLDSLNVVRLASFIEQECNISIPPEDMLLEHFGSLEKIEAYLLSRQ